MSESRFIRAVERFNAMNAEDPTRETADGKDWPRELLRAEQLARWIEKLRPDAGEPLRLAARCQHLARFRSPRSDYPEGRIGYLKWRTDQARLHAETAERILREEGYDDQTVQAVRRIVRKQNITTDPDVQTMEDALCLAFLEHEYASFCDKHTDRTLLAILVKTWQKMSPTARQIALGIPFSGRPGALLSRALSGEAEDPGSEDSALRRDNHRSE